MKIRKKNINYVNFLNFELLGKTTFFDSSERESFSSFDRVPDPNKGTDSIAGLLICPVYIFFIVGFDVLHLNVRDLGEYWVYQMSFVYSLEL